MASFDGVDDYLSNAVPGLVAAGVPLTVGCWFNPAAFDKVLFAFVDTGVADPGSRLICWVNSGGQPSISARGSAAPQNNAVTTTALTLGAWSFGLWRFNAANNRRISVLHPSGLIEHGNSTTSITGSSLDQASIGGYRHSAATIFGAWSGGISEIWWADADVQADGLQTSNTLLRQLAYGGPFSIPSARRNIVEYHSLRSSLPSARIEPEEHYMRSPTTWTDNGGVSQGPFPPLPGSYERQMTRSRMVPI